MRRIVTGTEATAIAAKLCKPKVISAYPITPQTYIIEKLAEYVSNGELNARYISTDSELSSIGIVAGAVAEGVRAFTATASHGLVFMHEALHWIAGGRLPVVMAVATRGLGAPWILMCDMQDALSQRDTGWMMLFASNAQEAHDFIPIAYKVAEEVHIPCMVCMDGFLISHTAEPVDLISQEAVDSFLPEFSPKLSLSDEPSTLWPIPEPDTYYLIKKDLFEDHKNALYIWKKAFREWQSVTKRKYDVCCGHMLEDAKTAFVSLGATVETALEAARRLRKKGEKVGVIGIKLFRPFPESDLKELSKGIEELLVIDKAVSMGKSGILFQEVKSTVDIPVRGFIGSMGGKDLTVERIERFFYEGKMWI